MVDCWAWQGSFPKGCALAMASACSCAASTSGSSSGFLSSDSWCAKKHTRRLHARPSVQHCACTKPVPMVRTQSKSADKVHDDRHNPAQPEGVSCCVPNACQALAKGRAAGNAFEWCTEGHDRAYDAKCTEQEPASGRTDLRAVARRVQPAFEHAVAERALIASPAACALQQHTPDTASQRNPTQPV